MGENHILINSKFIDNENLTKLIIPQNVTHIGERAFTGFKKLEEVVFPDNIKSLGKQLFLNCRKLKKVILPKNIESLPDGMFDGCINLEEIIYEGDKKLNIGKKCFRNCKSITNIPVFVANFNERAFENCTSITSIDVIQPTIPFACFRGCTNLKQISNQENISNIESFAFSGCENLNEINLPCVPVISAEAFSNCKQLVKVRLSLSAKEIDSRAFYNCESLCDFQIPDSVEIIKKEAFRYCNSIRQITIPSRLKSFGDGAFACMESLEHIDVSPINKTFITPDNKILINQNQQKLVLYASGCKDKKYSLKDYVVKVDWYHDELIKPITSIGEFAFAGAKNLEELTFCSCTTDLEYTAFQDCPRLKKLNIKGISLFSAHGFRLRDHGMYFVPDVAKEKLSIPFESIEYTGERINILENSLQYFNNITNIIFSNEGSYEIASNAFTDCKKLEKVFIPKSVKSIKKNAFIDSTTLQFNNGIKTNGLVEMSQENEYFKHKELIDNIEKHKEDEVPNDGIHVKLNLKGLIELTNYTHKYLLDYTLYTLDDNTFYVEQDDKIITISKQYIDKICTHSEEIRDNPVLFIDFMNDLINNDLAIRPLFNGILMSKMNLHSRKLLMENLKKDDEFFLEVLKVSGILDKSDECTNFLLEHFEFVINKINILKKYNIKDSEVCHKIFMYSSSDEVFEELIKTDYELFKKIIRYSEITKLTNLKKNNFKDLLDMLKQVNLGDKLFDFVNLIKENRIKDKFLMNRLFIINNSQLCSKLISNFDKNMKRLLKASKVLSDDINKDNSQNFLDLLNLLNILGCFDGDPIIKQKACTFITEKLFDEKLPNGENNNFRIVGDDIHRIFNFGQSISEYDREFATFFLENYKDLIEYERLRSGLIERIHTNFKDISRTSTSNKGAQRKLKVSLDKCLAFLQQSKFKNVTEENAELATLIGWWYDRNETFEEALIVYNESLNAPRNIFTKTFLDDCGNIFYDNDSSNDLKEEFSDNFSYEWLPKQSYDNLVLGKYCNCCAHIEGCGQGIMRASMVLDNCQNLVIRDCKGAIIAKSTLYVNKEEGFAVFNNVESSLKYREPDELEKIYKAFVRGTNAFVDTYNMNNTKRPINVVTVGTNRNTILEYLKSYNHPEVEVLQALRYGDYSVNKYRKYNGDWTSNQRLVLKR